MQKVDFLETFKSEDRTFFHVTAAVLNCQGQIQPNTKIQPNTNQYNTLTNNNNMKI